MATIKNISDLSVGDWVKVILNKCDYNEPDTFKAKVLSVVNNSVGVGYDKSGIVMSALVEDLHPIPITAEMLEKNGFTRGQRGAFYHYLRLDKNRTLYIHASTNGWRVEITYDAAGILRTTHLMPDINSVHDLQHALRLAGWRKK